MTDLKKLSSYFCYLFAGIVFGTIFVFDVSAQSPKPAKQYVFIFVEEYRFANDTQSDFLIRPFREVTQEIAELADMPYQEIRLPNMFNVAQAISENPNYLGFVSGDMTKYKNLKLLDTLTHLNTYIFVPFDHVAPQTMEQAQKIKRIAVWEAPNITEFAKKSKLDLVQISHWTGATTLKMRKVNALIANPYMLLHRWYSLNYGTLPRRGVKINSMPLILAVHPDLRNSVLKKIQNAYKTILASGKYSYLKHLLNDPKKYVNEERKKIENKK